MNESKDELAPVVESETPEPRPKAQPIESRFLFVDIASMRAKQLRRGATPRLSEDDPEHDPHKIPPHKPERVAMEEVRRGLVPYDIGHNRPWK